MAENINISPEMIENLMNIFKNNNSDTSNSESSVNRSQDNNIDFDTILKLKSIASALNTDNGRDSNLLYSLKPYLRKSRQDKLDQYINILKISQLSKILNKSNFGDDN